MIVICENCGKETIKKPSKIGEHVYCSFKCMAEWRKNNPEYKAKLKNRKSKPRKLNEFITEGEVTKVITSKGEVILIDTNDLENKARNRRNVI